MPVTLKQIVYNYAQCFIFNLLLNAFVNFECFTKLILSYKLNIDGERFITRMKPSKMNVGLAYRVFNKLSNDAVLCPNSNPKN